MCMYTIQVNVPTSSSATKKLMTHCPKCTFTIHCITGKCTHIIQCYQKGDDMCPVTRNVLSYSNDQALRCMVTESG